MEKGSQWHRDFLNLLRGHDASRKSMISFSSQGLENC